MKQIPLVVDLLLDKTDLERVQNNRIPYMYTADSNSLYPKHINHLDYHHPRLAVSYGKDTHEVINLETGSRNEFIIKHQGLDKQYSVAMGITEEVAMIAIGDTYHTRIQVIDANQPLNVFLNERYSEEQLDDGFFPLPRYFTGNPDQAVLVYSDNSRLPIDLNNYTIEMREEPEVDRIVRSKTIPLPYLSILGPFIMVTITSEMSHDDLASLELLIKQAAASSWYAIDQQTIVNEQLVDIHDFDEVIAQRKSQIKKLLNMIE